MAKKNKKKKELLRKNFLYAAIFALIVVLALAYVVYKWALPQNKVSSLEESVKAASTNGFDQYGYNNTARIFNGTGESWSLAKGLPANYLGAYAKDKLIMKWNAEWDRGLSENWLKPPYDAWEDNQWNGKVAGGSGAVWHYKILWVGECGADYTPLPDGGYCIWGQFETIMDHGTDPSYGPGHTWFSKAAPAGYGAYKK